MWQDPGSLLPLPRNCACCASDRMVGLDGACESATWHLFVSGVWEGYVILVVFEIQLTDDAF